MKLIFSLGITIFLISYTFAAIRYVSKTGSSTPPYLTWETASDSIQKCINVCEPWDTIVVGNGIYKESILAEIPLVLIGSSMDSCIIDGTGLSDSTVWLNGGGRISGFNIFGKTGNTEDMNVKGIGNGFRKNLEIENCRIRNCYNAIWLGASSDTVKNVFILNVKEGIKTFCGTDTCKPVLLNSVIFLQNKGGAIIWISSYGGQPTLINNILVHDGSNLPPGASAAAGIDYAFQGHKKLVLRNNLFSGMRGNRLWSTASDSVEIINNIFSYQGYLLTSWNMLMGLRNTHKVYNNIFMHNDYTLYAETQPNIDYNIFWKNTRIYNGSFQLGEHDIFADPMLVKDTMGHTFLADYHLQMFSPGIDKGHPDILDVDGSRSDIGLYGGPYGQKYTYSDLPPSIPKGFSAVYSADSAKVIISWEMNTEQDLMKYIIYRSDRGDFIPDSTNRYSENTEAVFSDTMLSSYEKLYYRITAVDSQGNESQSGQLIAVTLSGVDPVAEIITGYSLYQNYPNPFNSKTIINYGISKRAYVKLMLYAITGELLKEIVNGEKEPGIYETSVDLNTFPSGIYLYRIEATDENGIPAFMDMKKMVLLK